ncbi:MAG: flavodoxin family protein [Halanaerobiales bacterium]|nr:flavodoxin family protein [Halanaerobiales bacterium]
MKVLVTYSSRTGNTKKVAEGILEIMPKGTNIFSIEEVPSFDEYDFIALGFWVDKGTADEKSQKYMQKINHKKIGLFGTLGAYPDSEHAHKSMENVKKLLQPDNQIRGEFMCQGKIDPQLIEQFKNLPADHPHAMTLEREARHAEASKHPNEEDIKNAQTIFKEIMLQMNF